MAVYVAVCGPRRCSDQEAREAREVGRLLAERGAVVVCGGYGGVMAAVAAGARQAGGTVVGVLSGRDRAQANPDLSVALPTGLGEARNALIVRAADAVIVIGGSWGTLSELALAMGRGDVPVVTLHGWRLLDQQGQPLPGVLTAADPAQAVGLALGRRAGSERSPGDGKLQAGGHQHPRRSLVTEETAARLTGVAGVRDAVTVRLPADSAYLSVLRTATAGLAARLDFTLDEIEDLRIAVDEACAMLLHKAVPGTPLECEFELAGDAMRIRVTVATADGRLPRRDDFAWTVLTALAGDVDAYARDDEHVTVVLTKQRGISGSG